MSNRRSWILVLSIIPGLALFALLGWGLARSGGNPGGLSVNSQLGEVPVINGPAPSFAAISLDGTEINPLAYRGKVVMIDFWSSWCPPCRAESPVLSQVYQEYKDKGEPIEFIGIAIWDSDEDIRRFVDEFNLRYPNAVDSRGRIAIDYGVSGIPEKFFIDSSGTLKKKLIGPMNAGALRSVLDEMLADAELEQAGAS
ncbi:MAG: TlpA disulfide reductase family protein [Dehalococcoidia bacterium]